MNFLKKAMLGARAKLVFRSKITLIDAESERAKVRKQASEQKHFLPVSIPFCPTFNSPLRRL